MKIGLWVSDDESGLNEAFSFGFNLWEEMGVKFSEDQPFPILRDQSSPRGHSGCFFRHSETQ